MLEYDPLLLGLLITSGLVAGFINTLAGGGSMLTLPALLLLGIPADVANGTNRIGILLQSLIGARGFDQHDLLDRPAIAAVLSWTLAGALVGALAASSLPLTWLEPVLLVTMIAMALAMLLAPSAVAPPPGTPPRSVAGNPRAAAGLFLAGAYGGFIQAGVGFMLIAALAGGLRYDLRRTNALKLVCTAALTAIALLVFVARGQVWWIPGLLLATGTMAGAWLSVRVAVSISQTALKWILFAMVVISCGAALLI